MTMGWGPDLQKEIQGAKQAAAGRRGCWQLREARLEVLPADDRSLPHGATPSLDEERAHHSVPVVPVPDADTRLLLQGVPQVEGPAEDPVGRGAGGKREGARAGSKPGTYLPMGGAARRY